MKHIALILVFWTGAASCSKESCWECDVNANGVLFKESFCNMTKKEIQNKQDNPQETKDAAGTVIFTTSYSNCARK